MIEAKDITLEFLKKRPLSKSSLSEFNKSPKHYVQYLNEKKDSSGFFMGNLVDCLVLEEDKFDSKYFVYESADRRTKAGKMMHEAALLEAANRTLVTNTDYQTALYMKESLMSNYEASKILEAKYDIQRKLKWNHRQTKLPLIGFQDFRSNAFGEDLLVDLKTSQSADPIDFDKLITKFSYDLQAALYLDYYRTKLFEFPNFCFIIVENKHPYHTSVIHLDSKYINDATSAMNGTMKAFEKAMQPYMDFDNHFHLGYEYRLVGTGSRFTANYPTWHKHAYLGFDE